jgi:Concanavalin A-like lectin/glucanases superfamily
MPTAFRTMLNPSGATDPNFANVTLLLHMDGSNGSTTFTDSSSNAFTMTAAANAQISTTQSKWNGASGYFDGAGDTVTASANAAFALGSGDFTIEVWLYSLDSGSSLRCIYDNRSTNTSTTGIMIRENSGGFLVYINNTTIASTTTGRTANTWQHLAVVRSSGTVTIYVDGTSIKTGANSTNLTDTNCRISGFVDTQVNPYAYYGYMDDLRITKSVARYTANFTAPTEAFPDS